MLVAFTCTLEEGPPIFADTEEGTTIRGAFLEWTGTLVFTWALFNEVLDRLLFSPLVHRELHARR